MAAIDAEQWVGALRELAELSGSSHAQLIGFTPGGVHFNWINDVPPDVMESFIASERGDPDINVRVRASMGDSTFIVRCEEDYRAVGPGPGFDFYRDLCAHYGISHGCQTKLHEVDGGFIGLAIHRSESDGTTDADTRALFAAIAPHVRTAVKLRLAFEDRGVSLLSGPLENLGMPIFICNNAGQIKAKTSEAAALISNGRFRIIDTRLGLPNPRDDAALVATFTRIQRQPAGAETLVLRGYRTQLPLIVDVCRLPVHPLQLNYATHFLVIVRSARRWHAAAPAILKSLYGLSAAETEVALALANGESRDAIAAKRGTSVETVKAQLKSIFAKLAISREIELVAMFGEMLKL